MNKEYEKNQKAERKSFQKYRKAFKKILIWGSVAVLSAFVIPYSALFTGVQSLGNLIGLGGITLKSGVTLAEYIAANGTFFLQWGLAALGIVNSVANGFEANRQRKKIEDAQDEEENIVDSIVNENEDLKRKVEDLEKSKAKTLEEKSNVKTSSKEKTFNTRSAVEEDVRERRRVK